MSNSIAVELRDIKKYFGPVKANDGVNLTVYNNEIHAILGENGSGKSTLMNILSGLYTPDGGEILMNDNPILIHSPKDALEKGIGMIHQHFKLVEALSAWENIVGGMKKSTFLNKRSVISEIKALCEKYKLSVDPEKKVFQMTIGEKQTVEIMKALYRGARIMILDEPTAVLTVQETRKLFDILREMRQNGCAVLIITHKLAEVMEISDKVTVLRKGVSSATINTKDSSPEQLAEMMVGREIDITYPYLEIPEEKKKTVVSIKNLVVKGKSGEQRLNIPSLEVRSYEIMGIAGVADSGQKELCEAITGIMKADGSVALNGQELIGMNPRKMLQQNIHIGFVPEDRLGMGLASAMSISDNVALRTYRKDKGIFWDKKKQKKRAEDLIERYNVSTPSSEHMIGALSGGNIQKVLIGREIDRGAEFLIAAYPVRGLDIGATEFVFEQMNKEKEKGVAVLFVGEDLDMLIGVCDRIAVLHGGELMDIVDAKTATKETLGLLMMGQRKGEK